jgi:hypothetical protein
MELRFANLTRLGIKQQGWEKGILNPLFKNHNVFRNQNFHNRLYKNQSLHYIMGHNNSIHTHPSSLTHRTYNICFNIVFPSTTRILLFIFFIFFKFFTIHMF